MNPLAGFSDWVLAALARLFLLPGGACILYALALFWFAQAGIKGASTRRILSFLSRENVIAVALAWVALAILPAPGISTLPSQPNIFVLAAIPLVSMLSNAAQGQQVNATRQALGTAIIMAVLISAAVPGRKLLMAESSPTIPTLLALLTIGLALVAIAADEKSSLSGTARLLTWWGLALTVLPFGDAGMLGWLLATALLPLFIFAGTIVQRRGWCNVVLGAAATSTALLLLIRPLLAS